MQYFDVKKQVIERVIGTYRNIDVPNEIKCLAADGFVIRSISEVKHNAFAANAPCIVVAERVVTDDDDKE